MADFIAVIRRAVDGLADNTPDMRAKVYERARGAVRRQLENMKPRPPEAMLQRQLEKLEAAIREVDSEYAEALPADEPAAGTPVHADAPRAPFAQEPAPPTAYEEPAPAALPEHHEPAGSGLSETVAAQPIAEASPIDTPDALYAVPEREPLVAREEPVVLAPPQGQQPAPYRDKSPEFAAGPASRPYEDPFVPAPAEPDATHQTTSAPFHGEEHPAPARAPAEPPAWLPVDDAPAEVYPTAVEEQPVFVAPEEAQPAHHQALDEPVVEPASPAAAVLDRGVEIDAAAHFEPVWHEPAAAAPAEPLDIQPPAEPARFTATDSAEQELRMLSGLVDPAPIAAPAPAQAPQTAPHVPSPSSPVALQPVVAAEADKKMPAADSFSWEAAVFDDLPPIDPAQKTKASAHFQDDDILSDIRDATEPGEGWKEASTLRDYDRRNSAAVQANDDDAELSGLVSPKMPNKSFRVEPKRRSPIVPILITLVVLALLGGGGYAAWMKRDELTAMVADLMRSVPLGNNDQATPPASTPPAQPPAAQTTPPANSSANEKPQPATTTVQNTPPPKDPTLIDNKFTQRLMADGTEVDSGPADLTGTPTAEGKTTALQTASAAPAVAPATPQQPAAQAPAADQAAAGTPGVVPGATVPGAAPANGASAPPAQATADASAAPQQPVTPPAGTERMFLYEEILGRAAPAAIPGSVKWESASEPGENGRAEPTVQATLTVPDRNLTAVITFKRNSDSSLPASHVVEVVFSVPPNFEGGAISSVERISLKNTEQDRGEPLVTASAKINDDIYIIALNNLPDARTKNLSLLSSRDWIDIPIVYRNGRRALLTFQKGTSGKQAFDGAMQAWAAMGDPSSSQ